MVTKKNKQPVAVTKTSQEVETVESISSVIMAKVNFPIVGIGASAGGLAAFESFFSAMPNHKKLDMAFVIVQHLAPDHTSILADLLQRMTSMSVFEVEDGVIVKPNCVYVIPPNKDMAFINGSLKLLEPSIPRNQRFSIDFLFRSLAQDLHEWSICIILSGTGSDGTLGLQDIKGKGGMVIAQSPISCEFDGMPYSAINTGQVDHVLTPENMPAQLFDYAKYVFDRPRIPATNPQSQTDNILKKLFIMLRVQTGNDFSEYKQSTIYRRIERRMALHQIIRLEGYVKYLQQMPEEINLLFHDLLIGVTNFFRDPEAFAELEKVITSELFANKPAGSDIRVWVCGCCTGEEAFSIAILLQEKLEQLPNSDLRIQIFASDIDKSAVNQARQGVFPQSIASGITPSRLARHFNFDTKTKTYRIQEKIRKMLIFSEHNVIRDPPFSKLDLVSCRNLLIYMGPVLQKKVMSLFHYALNPGGFLFLGTSETLGEIGRSFTTISSRQKLYQRKIGNYVVDKKPSTLSFPFTKGLQKESKEMLPYGIPLQQLAEKALLDQLIQTGILVNQNGDILYVHGRAGMYLEPVTGGLDSYNIMKMARDGLQPELIVALHKAATDNNTVRRLGILVDTNGHFSAVNLSVSPVKVGTDSSLLFMVVLEAAASQPEAAIESNITAENLRLAPRIATLEQALRDKDSFIQSASEKQLAANEELESTNDELQAINEELQSTNEELETSKEELQSVNEELATTNAELQSKALESTNLNNDMNNLVVGTGIATIFVDLKLNIHHFTPGLTNIISLIDADIGRPLMHFTSTLSVYNQLEQDLQSMLRSLIPREVEVQTIDGSYYMLRMLPYRTTDNRIEGAVINFINITGHKQAELSLKKANDELRLATVVRDANDAILLQDLNGNIVAWNAAAQKLYGWSESEALTLNITKLVPEELRTVELSRIKQLSQKEILETYHTKRLTKDGTIINVWLTATGLINQAQEVYAIATTERYSKTK
jgi:two-component system CheB/CheR fusion protein